MAKIIHDEISRELVSAVYAVVETAANDAVELDVSIINLYVNAPDIPTPARTETYAVSAGEMTLIAALRDAASGELLTRVYDHEAGRELGPMKLMTRGENISEAWRSAKA